MADNSLYETLGLSRGASDSEIRREYHKLAKKYHPDKNAGNEDKFKEIQTAYEILSDPQKRQMYDQFGMAGLGVKGDDEGAGAGDFPFGGGLFSQLFGGDLFGGPGGRRRRQKAETVGIPLEVTLEELYKGATKSVEYPRKELCKTCRGAGGKQGAVSTCRKCRGSGIEVKLRQIGPGMMQQMQSTCSDCGGSGEFIKERDRCKKCKGKRVLETQHKLKVPVTPGMKHEQKIPFRGEADQLPDGEAGDVIVILQQMDHTTFTRKGMDLFVEKTISLREALCGFKFSFEHLDGRKMCLTCSPGEVIAPGTVRGLEGEGMCHFRHHDLHGNLYFNFTVEFPDDGFIGEEELKALEKLMPAKPPSPTINDEDMEEVDMIDIEGTRSAEGEVYNDSDDDDERGGHGHRVGCHQQ